jgi:hypothetical protein
MKRNSSSKPSLTDSLLKELLESVKAESRRNHPEPSIGSEPLPAPDLYQDAGGGYNPDLTFPQD